MSRALPAPPRPPSPSLPPLCWGPRLPSPVVASPECTACPTAISATGASRGVWLSWGGGNKSPQTGWLIKSKDSFSHSRKPRCHQVALPPKALGRVLPASSRFRWPWLWPRPSSLCLQLLPSVCVPSSSDGDACHGFTGHQNNPGRARLKILHLITPAKTFFPNKATCTGTSGHYLLRGPQFNRDQHFPARGLNL